MISVIKEAKAANENAGARILFEKQQHYSPNHFRSKEFLNSGVQVLMLKTTTLYPGGIRSHVPSAPPLDHAARARVQVSFTILYCEVVSFAQNFCL
jgi:hypothetical protein